MRRLLCHAAALGLFLLCAVGPSHAQEAPYTPADTLAAIEQASAATGVPSSHLTRVVGCETGWTFNPNAVGDHGKSIGVAQIHDDGDELPRFRARFGDGADRTDPYVSVQFLADEIVVGRGGHWTCR